MSILDIPYAILTDCRDASHAARVAATRAEHERFAIPPKNASGIIPLDHRVLIKQDQAPDKVGSLYLPPSEVDKQKYAMTNATVIAAGSLAWCEAKYDAERFGVDFMAPVAGSRVKVGKYAGERYEGEDGEEYTMVKDEDIIGLLI